MGVRARATNGKHSNGNLTNGCARARAQQMAKHYEITKGRARARPQQMANHERSQMGANEGTTNHTHMGVRTPLRNRGCTKGGARARPRQMAKFRMATITNGRARARAQHMAKTTNGNHHKRARAHNRWQNNVR